MTVRFGITFLPNAPSELVEWVRTAEATGFEIIGIADSQSLYREVYVCAILCALNSERIRFGPRVINPLTRHPAVAASAAVAGTANDCIRKLERAVEAGARQFWMSVHFDDKVRFMRDWANRVTPAFRS